MLKNRNVAYPDELTDVGSDDNVAVDNFCHQSEWMKGCHRESIRLNLIDSSDVTTTRRLISNTSI